MAKKIIVTLELIVIIIIISFIIVLTKKHHEQMVNFHSAVRITNTQQLYQEISHKTKNAFIYANLTTDEPIVLNEESGKYLAIKAVVEHYVAHSVKYGKRYEWDYQYSRITLPSHIIFNGVTLNANLFDLDCKKKIAIVTSIKNKNIRCVYYAFPLTSKSTAFTDLSNYGTAKFKVYENMNIDEAIHSEISQFHLYIICLVILMIITCFIGFWMYRNA